MKANEFVIQKGLDETKRVIGLMSDNSWADHYSIKDDAIGTAGTKFSRELCDKNDNFVFLADLKRLVESHELVGFYGGLDKAKLRCYPAKHVTMESYHNLKQAIADVESCMESDK